MFKLNRLLPPLATILILLSGCGSDGEGEDKSEPVADDSLITTADTIVSDEADFVEPPLTGEDIAPSLQSGDIVTTDPDDSSCQSVDGDGPWEYDLYWWESEDGLSFTQGELFQYCADVPSIATDGEGRVFVATQAFANREDSSVWDKIGVRLSHDGGVNWGDIKFISLSGMPENHSRPFDPTIVYDTLSHWWRLFFSLSDDPNGKLTENTCTHSAYSNDGLNYIYEGSRFCADDKEVIDPAIVVHQGVWHYFAPSGAPQDGAHHATSTDGYTFIAMEKTPSDNNHNWTGNAIPDASGAIRFYGSETNLVQGNYLWYNRSADGGVSWDGFSRTNIPSGKDPGAIYLNGRYRLLVPTK
ncbi:MAG: exo-alpha-sialidase [Gammaproteobacteria bacterium]|nr:exo-alpha-sialidase [Gammaproteobacteria bacterium]